MRGDPPGRAPRRATAPEEDLDSPVTVALLALATRHRPVLFFSDACAEGDCELRQDLADEAPGAECSYPCAAAGCGACTPRAGQWAGSWEGSTLAGLRIPAPCSVLTVSPAGTSQAPLTQPEAAAGR